jgi:hypothetical protein
MYVAAGCDVLVLDASRHDTLAPSRSLQQSLSNMGIAHEHKLVTNAIVSFVGAMKVAVGALLVLGCVLLSGGSRARQHYSTPMTCVHVSQLSPQQLDNAIEYSIRACLRCFGQPEEPSAFRAGSFQQLPSICTGSVSLLQCTAASISRTVAVQLLAKGMLYQTSNILSSLFLPTLQDAMLQGPSLNPPPPSQAASCSA